MPTLITGLAALWLLAAAPVGTTPQQAPADAAAVVPSEALRMRIDQTAAMINGQVPLEEFFVSDAPLDRFRGHLAQMRERLGAAIGVSAVEATTPNSGLMVVDFERGQRRMRISVSDQPPHPVNDMGPAR